MSEKENLGSLKRIVESKRVLLYGLAVIVVIGAFVLWLTMHWISSDVRAACHEARQEFAGDCVEALMAYANSDQHTIEERNNAIWALGEIGDKRALPALEKLLHMEKLCPSPCNVSTCMCQYSVEKAIRLCEGLSIARWVWRWI
jgi:HEAT repeat protein